MSDRVDSCGLSIDRSLFDFVENELTPHSGIASSAFWQAFADINQAMGGENRQLLNLRDQLQEKLNQWHKAHSGRIDIQEYKPFCMKSVI